VLVLASVVLQSCEVTLNHCLRKDPASWCKQRMHLLVLFFPAAKHTADFTYTVQQHDSFTLYNLCCHFFVWLCVRLKST